MVVISFQLCVSYVCYLVLMSVVDGLIQFLLLLILCCYGFVVVPVTTVVYGWF